MKAIGKFLKIITRHKKKKSEKIRLNVLKAKYKQNRSDRWESALNALNAMNIKYNIPRHGQVKIPLPYYGNKVITWYPIKGAYIIYGMGTRKSRTITTKDLILRYNDKTLGIPSKFDTMLENINTKAPNSSSAYDDGTYCHAIYTSQEAADKSRDDMKYGSPKLTYKVGAQKYRYKLVEGTYRYGILVNKPYPKINDIIELPNGYHFSVESVNPARYGPSCYANGYFYEFLQVDMVAMSKLANKHEKEGRSNYKKALKQEAKEKKKQVLETMRLNDVTNPQLINLI
jgi:hypothetical protein